MQRIDKAKLDIESCRYSRKKKGWFIGEKFIGANFQQALKWLAENGY